MEETNTQAELNLDAKVTIRNIAPWSVDFARKAEGIGESIIRKPFRLLKYRPIYARRNQRVKMLRRENSKNNN